MSARASINDPVSTVLADILADMRRRPPRSMSREDREDREALMVGLDAMVPLIRHLEMVKEAAYADADASDRANLVTMPDDGDPIDAPVEDLGALSALDAIVAKQQQWLARKQRGEAA